MNKHPPSGQGLGPGLCGSDREIFERVWRRVMPEDRLECPVRMLTEEEERARAAAREASERAAGDAGGPPAHAAAQKETKPPQVTDCLGEGSARYSARLEQMIARELAAWRRYLALAACSPRRIRAGLLALAEDERRHAKRLSTAYFLISGVSVWPDRGPSCPKKEPLRAALRECFVAEGRSEAAYRTAAQDCHDHCLRALYEELAQEEQAHGQAVYLLLEQL